MARAPDIDWLNKAAASVEQLLVDTIDGTNGGLEARGTELLVSLEEIRTLIEHVRSQNEQLLAERHRYIELFHSMPLAILYTDQYGVIHEANHAALSLLQGAEPRCSENHWQGSSRIDSGPSSGDGWPASSKAQSRRRWSSI
jgi:PAS domain-containing protein